VNPRVLGGWEVILRCLHDKLDQMMNESSSGLNRYALGIN
jgi:hypothetical protein